MRGHVPIPLDSPDYGRAVDTPGPITQATEALSVRGERFASELSMEYASANGEGHSGRHDVGLKSYPRSLPGLARGRTTSHYGPLVTAS